ncbi:MAG: hypothetical protein SLRJCFUN_000499 [Candidatus Fervidibacter sp.]|jgi:hypothetical protein
MLYLAHENGLLTSDDLNRLRELAEQQTEFCDEKFAVTDERTPNEFAGFKVWWRKHPVLRQDVGNEATVEIELRHRQRAVGFQAMVFLLVPIQRCVPSVVGRTATPKEVVKWPPSTEVLKVLVRAFAVASRPHRDNMIALLSEVRRECG